MYIAAGRSADVSIGEIIGTGICVFVVVVLVVVVVIVVVYRRNHNNKQSRGQSITCVVIFSTCLYS